MRYDRGPERKQRSRELRRNQTPAEAEFWEIVRRHDFEGLKFRRQHPIGQFIADFYCPQAKLAIELDGPIHEQTKEHDEAREEAIARYGIRVLRFTNQELFDDASGVLERVRKHLSSIPSPRTWRGG